MSVPFYYSVTDKVAREKLGISTPAFNVLIDKNLLLTDSLNTNKTFVCSASLEKYIEEFGGKEARFRDEVDKKLFEESIKEISHVNKEVKSITKSNKKNFEDIKSNSLYHYTIKNSFNDILSDIIKGTSRDVGIIADKTLSDILGSSIKKLHQMSEYKKMPYAKDEIANIEKYMETIKLFRKNSRTLKELYSFGLTDSKLNDYYENDNIDFDSLFPDTSIELDSDVRDLYSNFFKTYKSTIKAYQSIDYKLSDMAKQEIMDECEKKYNANIVKCIF